MAIDEPKICAINGSHVPSRHDITVFRGGELDDAKETWDQNALYFQIDEDERFLADSGYNGEPSKIVVTKDEHSSEFKEFMARAKNRHETLHTRLKSFNILGHCFRHGKKTPSTGGTFTKWWWSQLPALCSMTTKMVIHHFLFADLCSAGVMSRSGGTSGGPTTTWTDCARQMGRMRALVAVMASLVLLLSSLSSSVRLVR